MNDCQYYDREFVDGEENDIWETLYLGKSDWCEIQREQFGVIDNFIQPAIHLIAKSICKNG